MSKLSPFLEVEIVHSFRAGLNLVQMRVWELGCSFGRLYVLNYDLVEGGCW